MPSDTVPTELHEKNCTADQADDGYYARLVSDWPPLTSEQVQVLRRALTDPREPITAPSV